MTGKSICIACAAALVAACNAQQADNQANTVMPSAETHNAATAAAPLTGDQALAAAKEREEHMEAFGDATKKVHNELKSGSPDIAMIRNAAAKIHSLAPELLTWFPKGTAEGVGKSRAKAEIWDKAEDFAIKAHDLEIAANQFNVAAQSGDLGEIRTTFDALGKACKACHDLYRAPKKD